MSRHPMTLAERHADATQKLILDAAVAELQRQSAGELTMRSVARRAGISERTIFRYYATRDDFLDAVAGEVMRRIDAPPPPAEIDALPDYPRALFTRFEEQAPLVKAALHSDVFHRVRTGGGEARWRALQTLVDNQAPDCPKAQRRIAAANMRYFLAGTTWNYYRFYYGFSLEETIAAAEAAIRLTIEDLRAASRPKARRAARGRPA